MDYSIKNIEKNYLEHIIISEGKRRGYSNMEIIAILSQVAHESDNFKSFREHSYRPERAYELFPHRFKTLENAISVYSRHGGLGLFEVMYGNRKDLGNDSPGDGARYFGRGAIMTTGKFNYQTVEDTSGFPVVKNPKILENPIIGTYASVSLWHHNIRNKISNISSVRNVTLAVNGGYNGLEDREKYFEHYKREYHGL